MEVNNLFVTEQTENGIFKCYQEDKSFKILSSYELENRDNQGAPLKAHRVSQQCFNDIGAELGSYQACIVNGYTKGGYCGKVCSGYNEDHLVVFPPEAMCDGVYDCQDLSDEHNCGETIALCYEDGSQQIPNEYLCDGSIHYCVKDRPEVIDESDRWCYSENINVNYTLRPGAVSWYKCRKMSGFLHPSKFCDGTNDCGISYNDGGYDELRCNPTLHGYYLRVDGDRLCQDNVTRVIRYLHPEQICGNPRITTGAVETEEFRPCWKKLDQIHCNKEHTSVHGLRCLLEYHLEQYVTENIHEFFDLELRNRLSYNIYNEEREETIISKYLLCDGDRDCENGIDEKCQDPNEMIYVKNKKVSDHDMNNNTRTCLIHRHYICDGHRDCLEGEDELESICETEDWKKLPGCVRIGARDFADSTKTSLIHVDWINDTITDCRNGVDEEIRTQICPVNFTNGDRQIRNFKNECPEVYKCTVEMENRDSYVEIIDLCQSSLDTCERQNRICQAAKTRPSIETTPIKLLRVEIEGIVASKHVAPCLPGLMKYRQFNCTTSDQHIFGSKNRTYGIMNTTWVYEEKVRDCSFYFGETFLFLTCNDLCFQREEYGRYWYFHRKYAQPRKCPFKQPKYQDDLFRDSRETYPVARVTVENEFNRGDLKLRLVAKTKNDYQLKWFGCDNGKVVLLNEVCNLVNDCGDNSDEWYCSNSVSCPIDVHYDLNSLEEHSKVARIPLSSIHDGKVDCKTVKGRNKNDECAYGIFDGSYLLSEYMGNTYKFAIAFGVLATAINSFVIAKNIWTLRKTTIKSVLFGDTIYILMISVGDFCIGVYLLLLIMNHWSFGDKYCPLKYRWLSSNTCNLLGALSTFGSQISLLSMTVMSILRARNLSKSLSFRFSRRLLAVYIILALAVVILSVVIAVTPLLDIFEDYFLNGQVYGDSYQHPEEEIKLSFLLGQQTKRDLVNVVDAHYGSTIQKKLLENGEGLRWSEIRRLFEGMFTGLWRTKDSGISGIPFGRVGFYGSSAVCLFKYFVTKDDPQHMFSIAILWLNLACFVIITASYLKILHQTTKSSQAVAGAMANKSILLQTKISMIILSDAVCWLPFITYAFLHYTEIENAEKHYLFFSVILLPVNSVVNPIIYNYNHTYVRQKGRKVLSIIGLIWARVRSMSRDSYLGSVFFQSELLTSTVTLLPDNDTPSTIQPILKTVNPQMVPTVVKYNVRNSLVEIEDTDIRSMIQPILRTDNPQMVSTVVRYNVENSQVEIEDTDIK